MKNKKILLFCASAFVTVAAVVLLAQTPLYPIAKYRIWPDHPVNKKQSLNLNNLTQKVSVVFDSYGVPHIEAKNLADLVRATGFVQARYRGFQLDLLRRFASGRLSEFLGDQKALNSSTVEFDLAMRGWGFAQRSKIDLDLLPEKDQIILRAFTDGINQGMKRFPTIEHKILGARPEPWKYEDTLLVGLLQAWSITHNWEQEAVKFAFAMNLGADKAQEIYPLDPLYDY
ncbi:MAG: penicillin acylase family protein, partial [Bacteriovoracaceae bacterium]